MIRLATTLIQGMDVWNISSVLFTDQACSPNHFNRVRSLLRKSDPPRGFLGLRVQASLLFGLALQQVVASDAVDAGK